MDAHDFIQLLGALSILIGAITALMVVYYHHDGGSEPDDVECADDDS
jgi:hypothetical protein